MQKLDYSRILNTIEVYGKIYLCNIKYIKNAETFKRHIVQEAEVCQLF